MLCLEQFVTYSFPNIMHCILDVAFEQPDADYNAEFPGQTHFP